MNWPIIILSILLGIAVFGCLLMGYYLYRFARIIFVFEDDLSFAIEELFECEEQMNKIVTMKLFFDSLETRQEFQKSIDLIKLCRMSVVKLAERFVERSKQKYEIYEEPEEDSLPQMMAQQEMQNEMQEVYGFTPGQLQQPQMQPQTDYMFMSRNGQTIRK